MQLAVVAVDAKHCFWETDFFYLKKNRCLILMGNLCRLKRGTK